MKKQSIGKYISSIYRCQSIIINRKFEQYGIGSGQYIFLVKIAGNPGINQRDLSIQVGIDRANTHRAIKKLEELGYIYTVRDDEDKRVLKSFLSEEGEALMPKISAGLADITKILTQGIDKAHLSELYKLLGMLEENAFKHVKSLREESRYMAKNRRLDVTNEKVNTILRKLAAPMILGILGMVLFNLTDTYFVGKLGTLQIAALSFTFPVVMVFNSINMGIGIGAAAVISKAVGEQEKDKVKRSVHRQPYAWSGHCNDDDDNRTAHYKTTVYAAWRRQHNFAIYTGIYEDMVRRHTLCSDTNDRQQRYPSPR